MPDDLKALADQADAMVVKWTALTFEHEGEPYLQVAANWAIVGAALRDIAKRRKD
jgi:hypothetical protein